MRFSGFGRNALARCFSSAPLRAFAHGEGVNGALGLGDTLRRSEATRIGGGDLGENEEVAAVASGWGHSAVLTKKGQVYLMGRTHDVQQAIRFGRMALNRSPMLWVYEKLGSSNSIESLVPKKLPLPEKATAVATSAGLTAVIGESGALYMSGSNWYGQCATGERDLFIYTPNRVKGIPIGIRIKEVALGFRHCIALSECGRAFTWGKGQRGQLGLGPSELVDKAEATEIDRKWLGGERVVQIGAGFNSCVALTSSGVVFQWGKFLGNGTEDAVRPARVNFGDTPVRRVWAGQQHNLALLSNNTWYQWGRFSDKAVSSNPAVSSQVEIKAKDGTTQRDRDLQVRIPVEVPLSRDLALDPTLAVALGFDESFVTADSLRRPLVWDWNLAPIPLDLFEPTLAPLLQANRIRLVSPGWIHRLFLAETCDFT